VKFEGIIDMKKLIVYLL